MTSFFETGADYDFIASYLLLPERMSHPCLRVRTNLCMLLAVYLNSYIATYVL
jgi:hypothetical protein